VPARPGARAFWRSRPVRARAKGVAPIGFGEGLKVRGAADLVPEREGHEVVLAPVFE